MLNATLEAPSMGEEDTGDITNIFLDFIRDGTKTGSIIVEVDGFPLEYNIEGADFAPSMGAASMDLEGTAETTLPSITTLALSTDGVRFGPDDPISPGYQTEGRLARRISIRSFISVRPDTSESAVVNVGDIEAHDQDEWLQPQIEANVWAGRRVRILYGPRGETLANYRIIAETYAQDWTRDTRGNVTLRLQDLRFALDRELQTRQFGGTGGLEGDIDVQGRLKPRLIGHRLNFEPILFNKLDRWHMINDGPIEAVIGAYYGGAPLDFAGDYPDLISFATAAIPEGSYATSLALGIIKDRPAGGIEAPFTVEAFGDNTNGYSALLGDLIAKVFVQFAGFDLTDYDGASLAQLNIGAGSYWFDGSTRVKLRTIVERLALDGGGRLIPGAKFSAIILQDPDDSGAAFFIGDDDIKSSRRGGRILKPVLSFDINWAPNDRKLSEEETLGTLITESRRQYLQSDGRVLQGTPVRRLGDLDFEDEITLTTSLTSGPGVSVLSQRTRNLLRFERFEWDFEIFSREALLIPVGSIVNITHRKTPWRAGRNAIVINADQDFNKQITRLKVLV